MVVVAVAVEIVVTEVVKMQNTDVLVPVDAAAAGVVVVVAWEAG